MNDERPNAMGRSAELSTCDEIENIRRSGLSEIQDRLNAIQREIDALHDVVSTILAGAGELVAELRADQP